MLKELLSSRLIQGSLVFVVFVVVGSMLYSMHVEREGLVFRNIRNVSHVSDVLKTQETREKARTDKIIERFEQQNASTQAPPAEAEPESGVGWAPNSDGDEWHASPPEDATPERALVTEAIEFLETLEEQSLYGDSVLTDGESGGSPLNSQERNCLNSSEKEFLTMIASSKSGASTFSWKSPATLFWETA